MRVLMLFLSMLLFAGSVFAAPPQAGLGSKEPGLFNLKGSLYYLTEEDEGMPADLAQRKIQGTLYTDRFDVPIRDFTEGFPGVSDRFEWFGLVYTGTFQVPKDGAFTWRMESDDGSMLWIDGKEVIANDGVHATQSVQGDTDLKAGPHTMKVWFFQGPAQQLGIQLWVTPAGKDERIFAMGDFASGLSAALNKVKAVATPEGIKVELDAAILFDSAKWDLKPAAKGAMTALAEVIKAYPGCTVRVEGHTDNVGADEANNKLSKQRADSVVTALGKAGVGADVKFQAAGFGSSRPVAKNETESGRAKNRRVELFIKP